MRFENSAQNSDAVIPFHPIALFTDENYVVLRVFMDDVVSNLRQWDMGMVAIAVRLSSKSM